MSVKPILFNTEMVRAILDGRKTVTRRVVKPQPVGNVNHYIGYQVDEWRDDRYIGKNRFKGFVIKPPYEIGNVMWVRETWCRVGEDVDSINFENSETMYNGQYLYRADGYDLTDIGRWHPSIHMPKEAARIFLRVTDIRVERLQDITDDEAALEGAEKLPCEEWVEQRTERNAFAEAWDKTVPRHPNKFKRYLYYWKDNPWVWVIEFERCEKPEGWKNET